VTNPREGVAEVRLVLGTKLTNHPSAGNKVAMLMENPIEWFIARAAGNVQEK
jgi:hypothetical protein